MGKCFSVFASPKDAKQKEVNGWNSKRKAGDFTSFVAKFNSSGSGGGGSAAATPADGLLRIPGRLFGNGSSSIASLHTQQGKKGTNQDAMIVWENFSSRGDEVFCGVFDGHGPNGHMVAKTVRDSLPILLSSQWLANSHGDQDVNRSKYIEEGMNGDWCYSQEVEDTEKIPEIYLPLKKAMLKAFKMMDKELKLRTAIDCLCSGSTAVTLVKKGQDLILGNIGDSRAVLATRDKDYALTAVQLTTDLKPNLPREAARIQQCKGRVFALQDEPEVARVWLPNSDSPGLAMARAFGDFCLKDFGLISVPEVYYRHLTERDEFVVLATDGVWDVLSNKEAVDIIASAPSRATAARALVDCATRAWRLKYPTSKTDDCAVVCLFLEKLRVTNAAPTENGLMNGDIKRTSDYSDISVSDDSDVEDLGTFKENGEIVPASESPEDSVTERGIGQSKRSLAECLTTREEEEWSALEGITRVNSLLSIPRFSSGESSSTVSRFSSGERSTASWRRWL